MVGEVSGRGSPATRAAVHAFICLSPTATEKNREPVSLSSSSVVPAKNRRRTTKDRKTEALASEGEGAQVSPKTKEVICRKKDTWKKNAWWPKLATLKLVSGWWQVTAYPISQIENKRIRDASKCLTFMKNSCYAPSRWDCGLIFQENSFCAITMFSFVIIVRK